MTRKTLASFLFIFAVSALCFGQNKMSVDDVLSLKAMGYSDDEILGDLKKNKTQFPAITSQDIEKLRKNGVGPQLTKYLRTFRKKLSEEDIIKMVQKEKDPSKVIRMIAGQELKLPLTPAQIISLSKKGVPFSAIFALRGKALVQRELLLLARKKTPGPEFIALVEYVGVKEKPSLQESLQLHKAGVPREVLLFIKKLKKTVSVPPTHPVPTPTLQWQSYSHPVKQYTLQIPKSWKVIRWMDRQIPRTSFAPQDGDVFVEISYYPFLQNSFLARTTLPQCYSWYLPSLLSKEPDLKALDQTEKLTLGGNLPGQKWTFEGTMKGKTAPAKGWLVLSKSNQKLFVLTLVAPQKEFSNWEGAFSALLERAQLGQTFVERKNVPFTPQEIIEKYKEAVVSVKAFTPKKSPGGTGTGFIIRSDGYLITNHHVVYDAKNKTLHTNFEISWDTSTGRETVPAQLISAKREKGSIYYSGDQDQKLDLSLFHRVDIALLKILTPGQYTPIPISPIHTTKLGDSCMAMGFPKRTLFQNLSLFVTKGVVVRFNRDSLGTIQSVYTDAKITHGNSGGPCVNLSTGGVFGINTFGYDIKQGQDPFGINDLVGYYGVISINYALEEFPQYLLLPPDYKGKFSREDYCEVAHDFSLYKRWNATLEILNQMLEREPGHSDALSLKGYSMVMKGDTKGGIKVLEESYKQNPKHYSTLMTLALVRKFLRRYTEAADLVEQAIQVAPKDPEPYLFRARLYYQSGRQDDALVDVQKVLSLTKGNSSKAHILAGRIYYSQKKYDQGKEEFNKATQVDPYNLSAHLGLGEYYEIQQKWEAACLEYGKIRRIFPSHPSPYVAIGHCYMKLQQYPGAHQSYSKALSLSKKLGYIPEETIFISLGYIEQYQNKDYDKAFAAYMGYLNYHYESLGAQKIHILLARLYLETKFSAGLAYGHSLIAKKMDPNNQAILKLLPEVDLAYVSMRDLLLMAKLKYPTPVMSKMVLYAPLQIEVRTRQDMRYLVQKGVPPSVALMIYLRTLETKPSTTPSPTHLPKAGGPKVTFRFSSGGAGGTYHKLCETIRDVAAPDGVTIDISPSVGSLQNLLLTIQKKVDFTLAQLDTILALWDNPKTLSLAREIKFVTPICSEEIHIVVRKTLPIYTLQDLVRYRVHIGPTGSGTQITALNLMRAAGLNVQSMNLDKSQARDAFQKLLNGQLDGMFYTVAAPAWMFGRLPASASSEIRLLSLDKKTALDLQEKTKKTSVFRAVYIRKGSYSWLQSDAIVMATRCFLVTHKDISSEKVTRLLSILIKNKKALEYRHPKWRSFSLSSLKSSYNAKFYHPGVGTFLKSGPSTPKQPGTEPKNPLSSGDKSALKNNLLLTITSFKKDGDYWKLQCTIVNNNSVSIGNLKIHFTLTDKDRKILRTWTVNYKHTKMGPKGSTYISQIWSYSQYPNSYYISVRIQDFDVK